MPSFWWQPFFAPVFAWYLTLVALGWMVYPLVFRAAILLPDRGLGLMKMAGLLLTAFAGAWLSYAFPSPEGLAGLRIPPEPGRVFFALAAGLLLLAAVNLILLARSLAMIAGFLRSRWRLVLAYEAVFLGAFLLYLSFRSYVPDATFDALGWWGAEKWPNLAILTGLWRDSSIPPPDPWLADCPLNYYYFSHLMWTTLARLSGVRPEVAFNLGLGALFALLIVLSFSAGYALSERRTGGFWAVFLVACAGPPATWSQLRGVVSAWRERGATAALQTFSFWAPSDVIPNTRNEFPAFNWLLGDLHAHGSGLLLLLTAVAMLCQLERAREAEGLGWRHLVWRQPLAWGLLLVVMAAMWATNAWDLAVFALLGLGWIMVATLRGVDRPHFDPRAGDARDPPAWAHAAPQLLQGLLIWALSGVLAVSVCAAFYSRNTFLPLEIRSPGAAELPSFLATLGAIGRVEPQSQTTLGQWTAFWGLAGFGLVAIALGAARRSGRLRLNSPLAACLSVGIASLAALPNLGYDLTKAASSFGLPGQVGGLGAFVSGLPRLGLLLILAFLTCAWFLVRSARRADSDFPLLWVFLLVGAALACQIAPEFVFLDDPIGPPYDRYNTVFKLYYPAWGLCGLALAVGLSTLSPSGAPHAPGAPPPRDVSAQGEGRRGAGEETAFRSETEVWPTSALDLGDSPVPALPSADTGIGRPRPGAPVSADAGWRILRRSFVWTVILVGGGLYPLLGAASRVAAGRERMRQWIARGLDPLQARKACRTLDGLGFMSLSVYAPDDLQLGLWMRENLPEARRVAEASDESYTMAGRMAVVSGIPSFLGWQGHESQWRGRFFQERIGPERVNALDRLYGAADPKEALALCRRHGLRWVVVGSLERKRYSPAALDKFRRLGREVARFGDSALFEINLDTGP
ncbi:MAG TPA: DUF2298 domain-containing protein [Sumerlaeia bacterium]|nr:DUF2298 domain-containing protein [Sumerlaeia bacterium]